MTTPDPDDVRGCDCDDEPKLTAEEWEAVAVLSDEPGRHAAPEGDA